MNFAALQAQGMELVKKVPGGAASLLAILAAAVAWFGWRRGWFNIRKTSGKVGVAAAAALVAGGGWWLYRRQRAIGILRAGWGKRTMVDMAREAGESVETMQRYAREIGLLRAA